MYPPEHFLRAHKAISEHIPRDKKGPTDELFIKSKYVKQCVCSCATTCNSFYEFCPRCDSIYKNFQFQGREGKNI